MRRVESDSTDSDAPTRRAVSAPTARGYPTLRSRPMAGSTTLATSLAMLALLLCRVGRVKGL